MDSLPKGKTQLFAYILGFMLSIALTLAAYFIVLYAFFSPSTRVITILALGVIQAYVQLTLFLHLGNDPESKWHTLSFICMATVLLILITGSLWIMYNLYERVM
jgi:cytochrome o ubiquinol oxidase operon protein cyoD